MEALLKPTEKSLGKVDMRLVDKAVRSANSSNNYPIMINIGKHLMNSTTQDYMQDMFTQAGYAVDRTLEKSMFRYEALYLTVSERPKIIHQIGGLNETKTS